MALTKSYITNMSVIVMASEPVKLLAFNNENH